MAKAYYHREANPAVELFIVKVSEDKTVDLARDEKGAAIITGCTVTEDVVIGACTISPPRSPDKSDDGEPLVDPEDKKTIKKK